MSETGQNATFYGCRDDFRYAPMSRHRGREYTMEPSADLSTILNRILDTAADNLRVAKILIQLGLDPNNIPFDALFNRLIEIVLANITLANMFGLLAAIFFVPP